MQQSSHHVVRKGSPYGQFSLAEILSLYQEGKLLPDDEIFSAEDRRWLPLEQWVLTQEVVPKKETALPPATPEPMQSDAPPSREEEPAIGSATTQEPITEDEVKDEEPEGFDEHREGRRRRKRRNRSNARPNREERKKRSTFLTALPGWLVALFLLAITFAFYSWGSQLQTTLDTTQQRVSDLESELEQVMTANQKLQEYSPAGEFRGVILTKSAKGGLFLISGAKVGLYEKAAVLPILEQFAQLPNPINEVEFASIVNRFQRVLPAPAAVTVSDANGSFRIGAPDPSKEYLVIVSAVHSNSSSSKRHLWVVDFKGDGLPSPTTPLSGANAISFENPKVSISERRK